MTPESRSGLALQVLLAEQLLAGARETEDRMWRLAQHFACAGYRTAADEATRERLRAETTLALARKATGEDT